MRSRSLAFALLACVLSVPPAARAETTCLFAAPAPGYRVAKIDLPSGSEFATIRFTTSRPAMPAGDRSSWHLAMGFAIIDATTRQLVTSRIYNAGSSTRSVVVVSDDTTIARQDVAGPDVTFVHQSWAPVNRLAPGSYYVVGFGVDGGASLPNPYWGAEIHVSDAVSCAPVGNGEVFDIDHSRFDGGTQVSGSVAGAAIDATKAWSTSHAIVFGLMDVAQQGVGSASLRYATPELSGTVTNAIMPFVGGPGSYSWSANFTGAAPIVDIAGVAFDAA
jgi:hypothetical protein